MQMSEKVKKVWNAVTTVLVSLVVIFAVLIKTMITLWNLAVAAGIEDAPGFVQHFIDYEREECRHEG